MNFFFTFKSDKFFKSHIDFFLPTIKLIKNFIDSFSLMTHRERESSKSDYMRVQRILFIFS